MGTELAKTEIRPVTVSGLGAVEAIWLRVVRAVRAWAGKPMVGDGVLGLVGGVGFLVAAGARREGWGRNMRVGKKVCGWCWGLHGGV